MNGLVSADLLAPEHYSNRELSWLSFNDRVLSLAGRPDIPLLERVKFAAIAASNLDEFFMVRLGGLERDARKALRFEPGRDGIERAELLERAAERAGQLAGGIARVLVEVLFPKLRDEGIVFVRPDEIDGELAERVRSHYEREVHPTLTPIAVDPSHPFPMLRSGSLNLALRLERMRPGPIERRDGPLLALVQVPSVLSRFVSLPGGEARYRFVALEDIIARQASDLFPGHRVLEAGAFRVIRASDLDIDEDDTDDLLSTIQDELRRRDRGEPIRLEVASGVSGELASALLAKLKLEPRHLGRNPGPLSPAALMRAYGEMQVPHLKDAPSSPVPSPSLRYAPNLFRAIGDRDILLHHPYESFRHVVDFIEQAADDPEVVAIKQTLYRTSGDSPIVRALARAGERGKDVTALIELKARFDEANNIAWARRLEESGVHVVYGLIGLKTHAKMLLVTRREGAKLRRYLHLGTGNYHPSTARLYTDLGLFTAREDITRDAMLLFNVLTGYAELPRMKQLVVAPFNLRRHVLDRIDAEMEHAKAGRPCGLVAKMNSLVDGEIIEALYRASGVGVPIDLIVRGICCLRPGVPKVSENIRVLSILDRFLEHTRAFWWRNGGEDLVYLSSADWMPRNLNRRIEAAFPVLDPDLRRRVITEMFPVELADNSFAFELGPDGNYTLREPASGDPIRRAQEEFLQLYLARSKGRRPGVRPELPVSSPFSPVLRVLEAQRRRRSEP